MKSNALIVLLCILAVIVSRNRVAFGSRRFKRVHSQFTLNKASVLYHRLKKTCRVVRIKNEFDKYVL